MILTEEQRAALKRVVAYMDEMYAIASPYHGCTEDANILRVMIDGSGTVEPVGGFDLEKARAMICHYRIENPGDADTDCGLEDLIRQANLAEEALDEIVRLNAHINSACIESLRIAEERAAEIERLRASLIDLHAEYINTLEKNPECSAWDLDEQSDADQKRLRRNAAHAISIVEPPIYLQAEQRATKIKELEDALVEGLTNFLHYRASCYDPARRCPYAKECDDCSTWDACGHVEKFRSEARQRLQAEGKIGPDADAKPHCWQSTEERKAAIKELSELLTAIGCPSCHYYIQKNYGEDITVIRAMLTEADHDKP